MTLYEIDTIKQSLKKYAVVLVVGLGTGLYLSNCTFKPHRTESETKQQAEFTREPMYKNRELTIEEQRLKTFETYTRP